MQFSLSVAKRGQATLNYELAVGEVPLDLSVRVEIPTARGRLNSKNTIPEVPECHLSILKETYTIKIVKDFPPSVICDLNF